MKKGITDKLLAYKKPCQFLLRVTMPHTEITAENQKTKLLSLVEVISAFHDGQKSLLGHFWFWEFAG